MFVMNAVYNPKSTYIDNVISLYYCSSTNPLSSYFSFNKFNFDVVSAVVHDIMVVNIFIT